MADVFDIIKSAFDVYKKNYREVLTAFIALFAVTLIVVVLSIIISFSLSLTEAVCESPAYEGDFISNIVPNIVCEYTKPSSLINTGLSWVTEIVMILVILAVIKPLEEIISARKKISKWTAHISSQLSNAVKLFLLNTLVGFVTFIPVFIMLLLLVPDVIPLLSSTVSGQGSEELNALILKSIGFLAIGIVVGVLLEAVLVLLFTFVRVELVLTNQGLMSAVENSMELFRDNMSQVFMFHVAWGLIGFGVGILTAITCCMAIFVGPILGYMLVLPVRLMSEIMFWRKLKSSTAGTPTPESSEGSAVVY